MISLRAYLYRKETPYTHNLTWIYTSYTGYTNKRKYHNLQQRIIYYQQFYLAFLWVSVASATGSSSNNGSQLTNSIQDKQPIQRPWTHPLWTFPTVHLPRLFDSILSLKWTQLYSLDLRSLGSRQGQCTHKGSGPIKLQAWQIYGSSASNPPITQYAKLHPHTLLRADL